MTAVLRSASHVIERNARVYRRRWRGSVFMTFLQPALFLLAIGGVLGAMVDRQGSLATGGRFLDFLAPGLLAATCMQTATFESTYPIAARLAWRRNYEAILATPTGVTALVLGELGWVAIRLAMIATSFFIVMAIFGVPRAPSALLTIPAAVLTGLAFSAPLMAYATTRRTRDADFNVVYRFIITPLFLFSGVFYPLTHLPEPLQTIARWTPLYQGVEVSRALTVSGNVGARGAAHLAYLGVLLIAGTAAAIRMFGRRLRT